MSSCQPVGCMQFSFLPVRFFFGPFFLCVALRGSARLRMCTHPHEVLLGATSALHFASLHPSPVPARARPQTVPNRHSSVASSSFASSSPFLSPVSPGRGIRHGSTVRTLPPSRAAGKTENGSKEGDKGDTGTPRASAASSPRSASSGVRTPPAQACDGSSLAVSLGESKDDADAKEARLGGTSPPTKAGLFWSFHFPSLCAQASSESALTTSSSSSTLRQRRHPSLSNSSRSASCSRRLWCFCACLSLWFSTNGNGEQTAAELAKRRRGLRSLLPARPPLLLSTVWKAARLRLLRSVNRETQWGQTCGANREQTRQRTTRTKSPP